MAVWFAGAAEGHPQASIWASRYFDGRWCRPWRIAIGVQADGTRAACWNPVLFRPWGGPLWLFYKVGPSPRKWSGMMTSSWDEGSTWQAPRRLPDGILGPSKNKPIQLRGGQVLSPSSAEDNGWRVHLERTSDLGATWQRLPALNDGRRVRAIQPSILSYSGGRLQILCRSKEGCLTESWSTDRGATWSPMRCTRLPNPNSGCDAVTLVDGRQLLVYNPTRRLRTPLTVAMSEEGRHWQDVLVLEAGAGEYSYPAVIQGSDSQVHVTYSWNQTAIAHVVLDPRRLGGGSVTRRQQRESRPGQTET